MFRLAALIGLSLTASPALSATAEDVFGTWLIESGRAIVEISPCADRACGAVVWLQEPNDASGAPRRDAANPEAGLRGRALCGLPMIGDFTRGDDGRWVNGFIYDPQEGKTYKSQMHVRNDGSLYVRGYIGLPLLGKSQVWTPVDDTRGGC